MTDAATRNASIAVVEDDPEIRDLIALLLEREGFDVEPCPGAPELDRLLGRRRIDLVILDLMLEGEDGLSICRRLQIAGVPVPVLIVTAKSDEIDRIVGLELGADDYLPKPFNPRELLARVRAILRRTREAHRIAPMVRERYHFSGWQLDADSRELRDPEGLPVDLSGGEFGLLFALVTHPQRVLSRDLLLHWTRGRDGEPYDRTIDVQLSRLRRKLRDDPRAPAMIRTVRGGGYLFIPPVSAERL